MKDGLLRRQDRRRQRLPRAGSWIVVAATLLDYTPRWGGTRLPSRSCSAPPAARSVGPGSAPGPTTGPLSGAEHDRQEVGSAGRVVEQRDAAGDDLLEVGVVVGEVTVVGGRADVDVVDADERMMLPLSPTMCRHRGRACRSSGRSSKRASRRRRRGCRCRPDVGRASSGRRCRAAAEDIVLAEAAEDDVVAAAALDVVVAVGRQPRRRMIVSGPSGSSACPEAPAVGVRGGAGVRSPAEPSMPPSPWITSLPSWPKSRS